jgi:hypothetical protein
MDNDVRNIDNHSREDIVDEMKKMVLQRYTFEKQTKEVESMLWKHMKEASRAPQGGT